MSPITFLLDKWEENNPFKKLSETVELNNPRDDYLAINPLSRGGCLAFPKVLNEELTRNGAGLAPVIYDAYVLCELSSERTSIDFKVEKEILERQSSPGLRQSILQDR